MNLNENPIREKYKEFYGRTIEQTELLIKDKRIPLTLKQIIERRLNSKQEDWRNHYFDTCDAVIVFKDRFKIIRNCNILKEITSKTKLINCGVELTEKEYNSLKGKEFKNNTSKEVVLRYLLGNLYKKYIKFLGFCPNYYLTSYQLNLRAFYVYGLENRSYVNGGVDLGGGAGGRLVGLASEMLSKEVKKSPSKQKTNLK